MLKVIPRMTGALSHASILSEAGVKHVSGMEYVRVGEHRLSDNDLEAHIVECGRRMEAAYARFERTGKGADRAEAGRWRNAMQQAIAVRSPEMVARLEQERGLNRA